MLIFSNLQSLLIRCSHTLYWCEENGGLIRRAALPLGGGTLTAQTVFSGLSSPYYLDFDLGGGKLYWGTSGSFTVELPPEPVDGEGMEWQTVRSLRPMESVGQQFLNVRVESS